MSILNLDNNVMSLICGFLSVKDVIGLSESCKKIWNTTLIYKFLNLPFHVEHL